MPGKVKVRILAGRNLPVMDKSSDTSDAFVEVKLGNTTYKTEVYRRSLNPHWNSEWFRFEVDDEELQDEPLQIRIMDYDTYSANDAIGKVYIDLNPLLSKDSGHVMTGWFPIYDTMHGVRGEINCVVKVALFSDSNRYRQSSCGVKFFYSPGIPNNFTCQAILGFVEELVVNDDPEYQWIDKIRTPRASNEARQTLFSKLSGEVQRRIGIKALDLGGNAVVGYQQYFDLEGESGIVVRGIGTAVMLTRNGAPPVQHNNANLAEPVWRDLNIQWEREPFCTASLCHAATDCPVCTVDCLDVVTASDLSVPPRVAFLSPCYLSLPVASAAAATPMGWLSHSSTPSPPPPLRSPSPSTALSSRLPSTLKKLIRQGSKKSKATPQSASVLEQSVNVFEKEFADSRRSYFGLSLEAETLIGPSISITAVSETLDAFDRRASLKRVQSQPMPPPSATCDTSNDASNQLLYQVTSVTSITSDTSDLLLNPFSCLTRSPNVNSASNVALATEAAADRTTSPPPPAPPTHHHSASLTGQINPTPTTQASATAPIVVNNGKNGFALTSSPKGTNGYGARRNSESDLSVTPKGSGSHSSSSGSAGNKPGFKFIISPESLHLLEYPFITMKQFPSGLIMHIGGVVSARSVKLLDQINNPEEPETRDAWWTELRKEIRSHTRALACNAVLGYTESTYISDDICVLSASGTAVTLKTCETNAQNLAGVMRQVANVNITNAAAATTGTASYGEKPRNDSESTTVGSITTTGGKSLKVDNSGIKRVYSNEFTSHEKPTLIPNCHLCHIPYLETSMPFQTTLVKCLQCKKGKVPDVLFMTIEPPVNIPVTGIGSLIQARVCRTRKDSRGEQCAKEMSDSLPFLEYELHRQLLSKLKVKGMNGLFGLTIQVSIGENMLVAVATGTGAYLSALPPPTPPKISSGKGAVCSKLKEIQNLITESLARNREHYGIPVLGNGSIEDVDNEVFEAESKEHLEVIDSHHIISSSPIAPNGIDLTNGNKESCVLEVDDTEDADIISLMIDTDVPKGYEVCNTEMLPGATSHQLVCNLQMFSQVYRAKLTSMKQFGHQFDWLIQSLFVKYRRLIPCCLTDLKFRVDIPEQDLVQITVVGTAVGVGAPLKPKKIRKTTANSETDQTTVSKDSDELMFAMDEDHHFSSTAKTSIDSHYSQASSAGISLGSNLVTSGSPSFHVAPSEHYGIELTPLSYIPGGYVNHYLGNLDFFFIRESSSIREYGGLNGFMHSFMTEVFAIVRAHVAALGGNAMIAFHMTQLILFYNPHKNQAQCLINVAGDAVTVNYGKDGNKLCPSTAAGKLLSSTEETNA